MTNLWSQVKAPQIAPNLSTTLTTWRRGQVSVSSWQQKHDGSPVCWFMIGHGNFIVCGKWPSSLRWFTEKVANWNELPEATLNPVDYHHVAPIKTAIWNLALEVCIYIYTNNVHTHPNYIKLVIFVRSTHFPRWSLNLFPYLIISPFLGMCLIFQPILRLLIIYLTNSQLTTFQWLLSPFKMDKHPSFTIWGGS